MKPDDIFISNKFDQELANAVRGDVPATLRVGYRYYTGSAGAYDPLKACQYFGSIAGQLAPAAAWLQYLTCRLFGPRDPGKAAANVLRALSGNGDPVAQTLWGRIIHRGLDGVPQDLNTASALYSAALSQFALAKTYRGELLLAVGKFDEAVSLFQQAAAAGETTSMLNLADLYTGYTSKWSYPKHFTDAKHWLYRAVQLGDGIAMYRLGLLYWYEGGAGKNPASKYMRLAFNLFQHSALSGYRYAAASTANCYANGLGVAKNPKLARFWNYKAA
jgi:TPR repeat protein